MTARDPESRVRLRKTARGWAEDRPAHCRACGVALGPRAVLVGTQACGCGRSHRTHTCLTCDHTQFTPEQGPECVALAFDERNMRAHRAADHRP